MGRLVGTSLQNQNYDIHRRVDVLHAICMSEAERIVGSQPADKVLFLIEGKSFSESLGDPRDAQRDGTLQKIPQFRIYANYALLAGCSTHVQAAASELESPFSCFHKVEVFQSLLKPDENAERACKGA